MNEANNKSEKMRILKQFIEREISQSDDKYEVSVAQILSNVNNTDIIKYVPDGFLNDDKKKIKYEAIANTAIYKIKRTTINIKAL